VPDPQQTEPASRFPSVSVATTMPGWYPALLASVSGHVTTGHRRAVAAANVEPLASYWSIGREILDRQHEEGTGRGHRPAVRRPQESVPGGPRVLAAQPRVQARVRGSLA